ncbi:MAG: hypothetical protein LJE67_02220 [Salaquimonas sp.]|jgi:hypothetical protein|nr:hypothetical protein [Salaquimonas sp.]
MPYRTLNPEKIIATAANLERRIGERFPDAGLKNVAGELVRLASDTAKAANEVARPMWWLRAVIALTVIVGALIFFFVGSFLTFNRIETDGFDAVQGVEASINTLVLIGLGVFALFRIEERAKRHAALKGLHAMRSLVHVIDMHQLTKDPVVFSADFRPTTSSPNRSMSRVDLKRYLDYCSEMLSLTGKVAALYAQSLADHDVLEAVNDIENLATNLSRKIWQKIMLIKPGNAATPIAAISASGASKPRQRQAP